MMLIRDGEDGDAEGYRLALEPMKRSEEITRRLPGTGPAGRERTEL
jgi:hypothetical protein